MDAGRLAFSRRQLIIGPTAEDQTELDCTGPDRTEDGPERSGPGPKSATLGRNQRDGRRRLDFELFVENSPKSRVDSLVSASGLVSLDARRERGPMLAAELPVATGGVHSALNVHGRCLRPGEADNESGFLAAGRLLGRSGRRVGLRLAGDQSGPADEAWPSRER